MSVKTIKNITKQKDILIKNVNNSQKQQIIFDKLFIVIHVPKIDKIYDYFVLQSICLVDTISAQKPKLKTLKCKYTFGSKSVSFSCKTTLRKRKLDYFVSLLNFAVISEMQRRHILISSIIDTTVENNYLFSFTISNTNVFIKLDEFYFKWNYPIVFNFSGFQKLSTNLQQALLLPIGL